MVDKLLVSKCVLFIFLLIGIRSLPIPKPIKQNRTANEVLAGQIVCNIKSHNSIRIGQSSVLNSSVVPVGLVEICVCSNLTNSSTCDWQTVSTGSTTDAMSWNNSIVICRELGYYVRSPMLQKNVPTEDQAPDSVPIYSTTFNCNGTESTLIDCATNSSTSGLTHEADAYVHCQKSKSPNGGDIGDDGGNDGGADDDGGNEAGGDDVGIQGDDDDDDDDGGGGDDDDDDDDSGGTWQSIGVFCLAVLCCCCRLCS